ncbi:MAG: hypothetical protein P8Y69_07170 [Gammaproteobacteria bacterium]|jgi:hypothetical protein
MTFARHLCLIVSLTWAGTLLADIPRTPDGKPDLQGTWANNAATPLERPEALADRKALSDEELAEFEARADRLFDGSGEAAFGDSVFESVLANDEEHESYDPTTGNYNHFWVVDREFENRTSLIVDPPNGRLPPLTEAAEARAAELAAHREAHPADSYTDRINSDRCITFGVPFIGAGYNGYFEIVQSDDHVAIMQEMVHETRIIPLDGRPHIPESVRQWTGDARGYWDGDTLVVETRNFSPKSTFHGHRSVSMNLTERYALVDPDTLQWTLTIDDPDTWTRPWTMVINLKRSEEPIFEYACHEGNYAMEGILAGARAEEAKARELAESGGDE